MSVLYLDIQTHYYPKCYLFSNQCITYNSLQIITQRNFVTQCSNVSSYAAMGMVAGSRPVLVIA